MTTNKVRAIPDGYHAITPFVIVKGAAQFIDFMKEAFQAVEIARVGEDGAIGHAEVRIGDSVVMLFDSKQIGQRRRPFSAYMSKNAMTRTGRR